MNTKKRLCNWEKIEDARLAVFCEEYHKGGHMWRECHLCMTAHLSLLDLPTYRDLCSKDIGAEPQRHMVSEQSVGLDQEMVPEPVRKASEYEHPPTFLSASQQEVLDLFVRGYRSHEIAERTGMSTANVLHNLDRAGQKLTRRRTWEDTRTNVLALYNTFLWDIRRNKMAGKDICTTRSYFAGVYEGAITAQERI